MTQTPKGQIAREGRVCFQDASVSVWEEGLAEARNSGGIKGADAWELAFKRQVFARIIQTLNKIGWTVAPWEDAPKYRAIALSYRSCHKGDLKGELSISGRHIEFKMWQDVTPSENRNGGRYDFHKEARMPYLLRLEMERTRRRIRDYLCNVFSGYHFDPPRDPPMGLMGLTADETARHNRMTCGHYRPALDRAEISMASNAIAADGGTIEHGSQVWALDPKGRVITGTAYHYLNSTWQIVTGRYGLTHCFTHEIFTGRPEGLRVKRNERARRKRLEGELAKAIKAMNYERAAVLRDILYPDGQHLKAA
ncbi:hypothetical protein D8I35_05550 [Corticibacter populi]|uniref:UVR domain-containing protein n=1 Tax=Corticibacter populi TaxID=1550736 RepID=A0A3M6R015_9BURK|nr:UvrB/UvrC motif-containing protein [Corticibacter populi]RMX08541.1 hypothetical protein D8I35_05550 [Corticibacter populi]RZS35859.1 UvrB/UvrC motif-containing protein [Corticibacter populi]